VNEDFTYDRLRKNILLLIQEHQEMSKAMSEKAPSNGKRVPQPRKRGVRK